VLPPADSAIVIMLVSVLTASSQPSTFTKVTDCDYKPSYLNLHTPVQPLPRFFKAITNRYCISLSWSFADLSLKASFLQSHHIWTSHFSLVLFCGPVLESSQGDRGTRSLVSWSLKSISKERGHAFVANLSIMYCFSVASQWQAATAVDRPPQRAVLATPYCFLRLAFTVVTSFLLHQLLTLFQNWTLCLPSVASALQALVMSLIAVLLCVRTQICIVSHSSDCGE
jgi:hypothetical protein